MRMMKTTHGAAAAAEMAQMEHEARSRGTNVPKDQTFKDTTSALANAKKLLARGEIKQADYDRIEKKLVGKMSMDEFVAWRKREMLKNG
jgi:uncharacterized membrane protein